MKRREFLSASAGLAGAAFPWVAQGESKPCPPSILSVSGADSVQTTCVSGGAAPSWFLDLPEKSWVPMAASKGQRLVDVYHGIPLGYGATFATMTQAWTGACVDQTRGELLFAANGGHGDYAGNEVYACSLRTDSPQWYRLTDPSSGEMIGPIMSGRSKSTSSTPSGQGYEPNGFAAMFLDGRMRAVHGWHSCVFSNGKVWYPHQSSPSGIGYSTQHAWSFDRNAPGIPNAPGGTPLPWRNDPGPWKWLGSTHPENASMGTAPPAALDPVTGKIWCAHGTKALRAWASLDTTTGSVRGSAVNIYANNTGQDGRWAAVVHDASGEDRWRLFVAPARDANGVIVLNLKASDPFVASAWSVSPVSNLESLTTPGLGAVYHKSSQSILLGNPKTLGGQLIKLGVPTRSDGTYDSGAQWMVSTVAPASGSANPAAGMNPANNGAWSKFNIIEDMGNGQSALVVCMEVDAPTYVYKLPVQGV